MMSNPISPKEVWDMSNYSTTKKKRRSGLNLKHCFTPCEKRTILHLTKILNCCLHFEHFSIPWKTTNVMIPKNEKDRLIQRTINLSLLNTIAKFLEILLLNCLKNIQLILSNNNISSTSNQLAKLWTN